MYKQVSVQFEDGMRMICRTVENLALHVGDLCITCHKNLHDYGRVIELHEKPAPENSDERMPAVIRRATLQDQAKAAENAVHGRMAVATCRKRLADADCDMHLLHVRYNFDRTLLIVSFSAEDRVDFRDLIKELSKDLSVHIEMRQVGVRDAARRTGGMGPCGRVLCCSQWLRKFEAINVKMAKSQNISLSASSISGMCGRLKCCLRYENDAYRAMGHKVPAKGSIVETPEGRGVVIDHNLITASATVQLDDHRVQRFKACSVRSLGNQRRKQGKRKNHEDTDSKRPQPESTGKPGA